MSHPQNIFPDKRSKNTEKPKSYKGKWAPPFRTVSFRRSLPAVPAWAPRRSSLHSCSSSGHETPDTEWTLSAQRSRPAPCPLLRHQLCPRDSSVSPEIVLHDSVGTRSHMGTSGEGLCAGASSVGSTRLMENRVTSLSSARSDLALLKVLLKVLFETESLIHHWASEEAVGRCVGAKLYEKWVIYTLRSSSGSKVFPTGLFL